MCTEKTFFHTLEIDEALCIGCSYCVSVCPTEAFRVKNGKSVLLSNQCVDCGKCALVCPTDAINFNQDDFEHIFEHKYRVAIIPSVFIGQFPESISVNLIYNAIKKVGFTHVYGAGNSVKIIKDELHKYQDNHPEKPLISTFCPAIVRLIQVRFPFLVDHLILQKTPLDLSVQFVNKELVAQGIDKKDIGIFYITPCAAKTVAIKDPLGGYEIPIAGTINMDVMYNKIYGYIRRKEVEETEQLYETNLSPEGILYSLTGGEKQLAKGKSFAIDGIHNVINFLEKVENDEITGIDFLELRACDESCAGGVLTTNNKFLTVDRLKTLAKEKLEKPENTNPCFAPISNRRDELTENMATEKVLPRSMMKLDDNINEAFKKMQEVNEILSKLPNVDCTMCGAPNCKSLAKDIVQGRATIEHCIFIQKQLEEKGSMTPDESAEKFKSIWGNKTEKMKI
ncbi:MAG: ferredoxin [Bacteroidetes bacterium]|nr:MAG: ferredoxin [Bacteroidota bacterium]